MEHGEVFICYSREDSAWKQRLNRFMEGMRRAGQFSFSYWDDGKIEAGERWQERIGAALAGAKAAVLLVSSDFLASDFIHDHEVPRLLERAGKGELKVFPLLVRPCPWEAFEWLRELQLANSPQEALSGCTTHRMEEVLTGLMWDIGRHVDATRVGAETEGEAEIEVELEAAAPDDGDFERPVRDGFYEGEDGFLTNAGVVHLVESAPQNADQRPVVGLLCVLLTAKQRTWYVVTDTDLFCVLDDPKTAAGGRRLQWGMPLGAARPVGVRERKGQSTGLVDIGPRQNWLYSQRLHPDPATLEQAIEAMIRAGRRS